MDKKNIYKIIPFLLIAVFFIVNCVHVSFVKDLVITAYEWIVGLDKNAPIEELATKNQRLYSHLMDINSQMLNLTGVKMVDKGGTVFVRMKNDAIYNEPETVSQDEIDKCADWIYELKLYSEGKGADFLYVFAPSKAYDVSLYPANTTNLYDDFSQRFINALSERQITYIDLLDSLLKEGYTHDEVFYKTDHHWRAEIGLWTADKIIQALGELYSFPYESEKYNPHNYNFEIYEDWFLGWNGKKCGRYFNGGEVDDFVLISPKYETSFSVETRNDIPDRNGRLEEVMFYYDNLTKDFYKKDAYFVYTGANHNLQLITNNLVENNKKILIVRDSFGCVVSPFLAISSKQTAIVELRHFALGPRIDLIEYIDEFQPDYVVLLFNEIPVALLDYKLNLK